ncbi:MAG: hypothetical protein EAX81_05890 [Candidatus Thorarchaeota archaeon]|nr:hypothetical protein [Candidatus Thorarchaeota archaeon]
MVAQTSQSTLNDLEIGTPAMIDPDVSRGTCESCIQGEELLCQTYEILDEHYPEGYAKGIAIDTSK